MQTLAALLPNVGWTEMLVIGIILLLLFGRRLPEVGRSLGQGIVEFKKGLKDVTEDIKNDVDQADKPKHTPEPAKFESARPAHNPDMAASAHTSSTAVSEQAATKESPSDA